MVISIDSPFQAFGDHLSKPSNDRILFSGPFGYGKSYFLKQFFKNHHEYQSFELSPVNYIVGPNEDIFEYIKIEIALQLITSPYLKTETTPEFTNDLYIHQYLKNKPYEITRYLTQLLTDSDIPGLKQIGSVINNALKAKEQFEAWKTQWRSEARTDFEKLYDFAATQCNIRGSIFEDDIITQILRLSLQAIKNISNKSNVLIIDDFDRLDPEHIFRILNILSVHQGIGGIENKFGFDKIIIVCSVKNIKKIYEHKYGLGVDFEGYIEKFYSTDIFYFNNQAAISAHCQSEFSSELDDDSLAILGLLLSFFVSQNRLSVRSVIKHEKISKIREFIIGPFLFSPLPSEIAEYIITRNSSLGSLTHNQNAWGDSYKFPIKKDTTSFFLHSNDFLILKVLQILAIVFGDFYELKRHIKELIEHEETIDLKYSQSLIKVIVPMANVVENYNEEKNIFSSQSIKADEGYVQKPKALVIDLPRFNAFGSNIIINVGWDEESQYDGYSSYYKNVNLLLKDSSVNSNKQSAQINQLLIFLDKILIFLEENKLLYHLGITS